MNFLGAEELEGIFTLGEDRINLASQIDQGRQKCDALREQIAVLMKNRDGDRDDRTFFGKQQERDKIDNELKEACWAIKMKHDEQFHAVLKGLHRKEKFRDRTLREIVENRCASVDTSTLADRVGVVFGPDQVALPEITPPSFAQLISREAAAILSKKVVGKNDVDVAAIIEKLASADWVKQGLGYLEQLSGKCPFCQQESPKSLKDDLEAYFDETFIADTKMIAALKADYTNESMKIQRRFPQGRKTSHSTVRRR